MYLKPRSLRRSNPVITSYSIHYTKLYEDEAERCTRLAILDHGRIATDGSPRQLISHLPGRAWLIEAGNLRRVQQALEGAEHVLSLAQIGATLRVLTEDSDDAELV